MPPTDGGDWLGVSSDGNEQRFYVRLIKQGKVMKQLVKRESRDLTLSSMAHVATEVEELRFCFGSILYMLFVEGKLNSGRMNFSPMSKNHCSILRK